VENDQTLPDQRHVVKDFFPYYLYEHLWLSLANREQCQTDEKGRQLALATSLPASNTGRARDSISQCSFENRFDSAASVKLDLSIGG
jgi:hypothetical protein